MASLAESRAPVGDAMVPPMADTEFAVPGMHCAGCIGKIERGLVQIEGIGAARVNFSRKTVSISYDPILSVPDLRAAMLGLGFEAEPLAEEGPDAEALESAILLRALAVAGFAAMNIMLLSVSIWSGAEGATRELFHWLSALIALPTVAYSGQPFFRSAWAALRQKRTNMDVPISIGVLLTTGMSLYETLTHGSHAWFDGAVMLLFFLLAGRCLDAVMRKRAREGIASLLKQTAAGAFILDGIGQSRWVEAKALKPGMTMLVAAGDRLAADGHVITGVSALDMAFLTGESMPVPVEKGALVHAGALNIDAPLTVLVSASGKDTAIADVARMMEQAAQGKSRYVRIADRASRLYAPAVHTLALLAMIGWLVAGAGVHHALLIAVAVLLITCPCALGLAVPAAQIVACGALMRRGVLIRNGSALERLAEVNEVIFDKTGTLTLGRPRPVSLDGLAGAAPAIVLALARSSRHPLCMALRRALETDGLPTLDLEEVREVAGTGIVGRWEGETVMLCRPTQGSYAGMATMFCWGVRPPVLIAFEDALRPGACETIAQLEALGFRAMIASGDRPEALGAVARATGLTAMGNMHPGDKLALIARLSARGEKILMVGDGLNDGPALAAGHASLAPASASDVSQLTADGVFMGDSLEPAAVAVRTARRTIRVVKQNFALAIGYNLFAVPLAIAGQVTPLVAAVAMSGSSLIVVANALRLRSAAR